MTAMQASRKWASQRRGIALLALIAAALILGAPVAQARTHVFVGVGVGWPHYYYAPPYYYYPPPYYYYPPPPPVVYYAPPPAYYVPAPAVTPQANCRTYQGDATNDQTGQPFYGTACLWPDGRWHIVN
jgi:hypothetical protein